MPNHWHTNALSRWREFSANRGISASEEADAKVFILRLAIDPFDIFAKRDHTGEWYAYISNQDGRRIGAGYLIDEAHREVNVFGFESVPVP